MEDPSAGKPCPRAGIGSWHAGLDGTERVFCNLCCRLRSGVGPVFAGGPTSWGRPSSTNPRLRAFGPLCPREWGKYRSPILLRFNRVTPLSTFGAGGF